MSEFTADNPESRTFVVTVTITRVAERYDGSYALDEETTKEKVYKHLTEFNSRFNENVEVKVTSVDQEVLL